MSWQQPQGSLCGEMVVHWEMTSASGWGLLRQEGVVACICTEGLEFGQRESTWGQPGQVDNSWVLDNSVGLAVS